jgi:heat shock protein HslJ
MTEQRIRDLLDDVARPVPAPNLAGQSWQRARTIRRRRFAVAGAVAAVAVLVVGVGVLPSLRGGRQDPEPAKAPLAGRTFVAVSVTEGGKPGEMPTRQVSLDFSADGKLKADLGCGEISSPVSADDGRLKLVGERTESTCDSKDPQPEWPRQLLDAGPAYRLDGDRLTLTAGRTRAVWRDFGEGLTGRSFVSSSLTKNGEPSDALAGTRARLTFTRDGKLYADVGCNVWSWTVDPRGRRLGSELEATEALCPDVPAPESWLSDFIQSDPAWRLDGATLVLTGGKTRLELRDLEVAEPDVSLEGRAWTGYTRGPDRYGRNSELEQTTLRFTDGKVSGKTGCSLLSGTATVSGNKITFGNVRAQATGPGCPERLQETDRYVRALLEGTLTFEIQSNELFLRPANNDDTLTLVSCDPTTKDRQGDCS